MNYLAETCMNSVDWQNLRTASPDRGAGYVPDVLRRLADATSDEIAGNAYADLDNGIVVQGRVFEAAAPVVSVLLPVLAGPLTRPARRWTLETLIEITYGWTDPSEIALGNPGVIDECRRRAQEGIWTLYGQLLDPDRDVRRCALQIIAKIDIDRQRVARNLTTVVNRDPDVLVADYARELLRLNAPFVVP